MTRNIAKSSLISGSSIILLLIILALGLYTNTIRVPIKLATMTAGGWPAGMGESNVFVGHAHNIFVGRVLRKAGDEPYFQNEIQTKPGMQFEVEVIMNIKGNLEGKVNVGQIGGYRHGILHIVDGGDLLVPDEENAEYFLKPGSTYLLATRGDGTRGAIGYYVLMLHPNGRKVITRDDSLSAEELRKLAGNDERVRAYLAAYPNEKVPRVDVNAGIARNSFVSLSDEKQAEVLKRIKDMGLVPTESRLFSRPESKQ